MKKWLLSCRDNLESWKCGISPVVVKIETKDGHMYSTFAKINGDEWQGANTKIESIRSYTAWGWEECDEDKYLFVIENIRKMAVYKTKDTILKEKAVFGERALDYIFGKSMSPVENSIMELEI